MSHPIQQAWAQGGSLTSLCKMAGLSRACYYRNLAARETAKTATALREQIQQVALAWSRYGYRRITKELHRQGIQANHKRGHFLCPFLWDEIVERPYQSDMVLVHCEKTLAPTAVVDAGGAWVCRPESGRRLKVGSPHYWATPRKVIVGTW